MKILIIEDQSIGHFIKYSLTKRLNAEVTWIKSYSKFLRHLDIIEDIHSYDVIVCDHNFPYWNGDRPEENGTDVFYELFSDDFEGIFIHCSFDPCPQKYDLRDSENSKMKFYSLRKHEDENTILTLIDFINRS